MARSYFFFCLSFCAPFPRLPFGLRTAGELLVVFFFDMAFFPFL
jgi:hypothetical protein